MVFRPLFVDEERRRRLEQQQHTCVDQHRLDDHGRTLDQLDAEHLEHPVIGVWFGFWLRLVGVELDVKKLIFAALALTACATAQISLPPEQASHVERRMTGETRYLRTSMYVTPLFGDSTKKFVTATDPKLVHVLNNPDGSSVNPGAIEGILPAGTTVRVDRIEFPSNTVMAERVLFTPRTLAWLYLDVAAAKKAVPHVLVLRPGLRTEDELMSEVERFLTREDPAKRLEGFSDSAREGIKTKTAVIDMSSEALEMAWGPAERKTIALEADKKRETWFWGDEGKRSAVLLDGRVVELKP